MNSVYGLRHGVASCWGADCHPSTIHSEISSSPSMSSGEAGGLPRTSSGCVTGLWLPVAEPPLAARREGGGHGERCETGGDAGADERVSPVEPGAGGGAKDHRPQRLGAGGHPVGEPDLAGVDRDEAGAVVAEPN